MLARLQQAFTIGGSLLVLAWAALCWHAGHPAWGLAGVAALFGGFAAVLALEFVALAVLHRADATPRATAAQLLRAWSDEIRAAPRVFCWRQPFRSRCWPDHLPAQARGRRGLLLVHGFVCNRGVWNRWLGRPAIRDTPVVAVNLEPIFGSIDAYVPLIETAVQRLMDCTGMAPVIVAHSMGGLAVRRWWVQQGPTACVHHVVTIGTPHHGTWLARCGLTTNARQMRRQSRWLQALADSEPAGRARHFTCFYGNCDNIALPPATATLDGADNRHLPGVAHVDMIDHPAPWVEVQRWLGDSR